MLTTERDGLLFCRQFWYRRKTRGAWCSITGEEIPKGATVYAYKLRTPYTRYIKAEIVDSMPLTPAGRVEFSESEKAEVVAFEKTLYGHPRPWREAKIRERFGDDRVEEIKKLLAK